MTFQKRSEPGTIPLVRFFNFRCQTFVLSKIKRSWSHRYKQNKHKPRVAKARAAKKKMSKSSGGGGAPRINMRARWHSRALFQYKYISGNVSTHPNPRPVMERGANACPGNAAENTRKREPEHTAWGGMCSRDCRGWVRVSEITLSGAGHCSGRGRALGEMHTDAIAHAAGCLAMPKPGPPRTGSHK